MGNATSTSASSSSSGQKGSRRKKGSSSNNKSSNSGNSNTPQSHAEEVAARAQKAVGESVRDLQAGIQSGIKKLEEQDHPAAQLLDSVCGPYLDDSNFTQKYNPTNNSFYSDEEEEEEDFDNDSRTISEDETTQTTDYQQQRRNQNQQQRNGGAGAGARGGNARVSAGAAGDDKLHYNMDSQSYLSTDYDEVTVETSDDRQTAATQSYGSEDDEHGGVVTQIEDAAHGNSLRMPMASAFARRCYFTKAGIGKTTQHYEGLTLTGNIVLMLAGGMKLKGCPTICDEDLRRVEQTYPNQFSRLPDELLLSSGWRRISKYCHFSNKPIPDGIPFFHSKQRLHPSGGYYFLLAAAVGMVRPIDVEPLTRDTLVLLETDYPTTCDVAPEVLITDPSQWTLVDKFCFFSGGPINTEEDVYYQADFDGNPIYMLAFLSPSLTPNELYKLGLSGGEPGLKSVAAVEEVESVYDLTERDFDDLKLYHLGPCRALPQYILQPQAWTKVLPPHFLTARQAALLVAHDFENLHGLGGPGPMHLVPRNQQHGPQQSQQQYLSVGSERDRFMGPGVSQEDYHSHEQQRPQQGYYDQQAYYGNPYQQQHGPASIPDAKEFQRDVDEEGAFVDQNVPIDEAIAAHAASLNRPASMVPLSHKMDPPDDEPPSLSKRPAPVPSATAGYQFQSKGSQYSISSGEPSNPNYFTEGEYYSSPEKTPDERYYESTENGKYYATSQEEDVLTEAFSPDMEDDDDEEDEFLSPDMSADILSPDNSGDVDDQMQHEFNDNRQYPTTFDRPPVSPRSPHDSTSEYSQSSAMRGAQDMLKRNRQRRLETARRLREEHQQHQQHDDAGEGEDEEFADKDLVVIESESGVTWDSGSEVTSVVSGSSVWTDNSNNPDRSSRRALILQMAKARMKGNKVPGDMGEDAIPEESYDDDNEEEKKNDVLPDSATEIDISGDLD